MYIVEIENLPMGYFLTVVDSKKKEDNQSYYTNNDIGKFLGINYGELAMDNGAYMEVSAEDLDGNDIEEYWFDRLEDCERVKGILEGVTESKNNSDCKNSNAVTSIFKAFLNKSLGELKDSIEYSKLVLENKDGDWKQYYMYLKGGYGLYFTTERKGVKGRIITCINIYHEDDLIECYKV
jgi:hypothetical protein